MSSRHFRLGDLVVYSKEKHGLSPGPRAKEVLPAEHGDEYHYRVDKQWVVVATRDDGKIVLCTRRGKTHVVDPDDRALRRATLLDRLRYHRRFPHPDEARPATRST
jgi:hypothetical protein